MRLAPLLAVLVLAAGCSGSDEPAAEPEPAAPPERAGPYLAYARLAPQGREEVWLARADGTRARRLAPGRAPAVSPDGSRVALSGGCDQDNVCPTVELVGTRGGRGIVVARRGRLPRWAPTSDGVVFVTGGGLASYELGSGRRRQLARLRGDWGFDVSPDGDEVVYAVGRGGTGVDIVSTKVDLYVVPIRGGTPRRLTRDGRSAYPVWGPTGIAFSRLVPYRGWGRHELWRIGPDGRGRRTITGRLPERLAVSGVVGLRPVAWSADGTRLLAGLLTERGAVPYAVDPARGAIRELGDYGPASAPEAISRDGRLVLVSASRGVEVVPWSGGRGRVLARGAASASWNR